MRHGFLEGFTAWLLLFLLLGYAIIVYASDENVDEMNEDPLTSYEYAEVTTRSGSLNMRKTASETGAIITQIPNHKVLLVIERNDDWTEVFFTNSGKQGYVMSKFLTFIEELPFQALKLGDRKKNVVELKNRLKALGYFSQSSRVNDLYDATMVETIHQFLWVNLLRETDVASPELQAFILWGDAQKNPAMRAPRNTPKSNTTQAPNGTATQKPNTAATPAPAGATTLIPAVATSKPVYQTVPVLIQITTPVPFSTKSPVFQIPGF